MNLLRKIFRWLFRKKQPIQSSPVQHDPEVRQGPPINLLPSRHKRKVEIYKVFSITPGRRHAWVLTNIGVKRKPLVAIQDDLLANIS